jgi:hypothetical protein
LDMGSTPWERGERAGERRGQTGRGIMIELGQPCRRGEHRSRPGSGQHRRSAIPVNGRGHP